MKKLIMVSMLLIASIGAKAQKTDESLVELKKWEIKDPKELIAKSKFSYTDDKKVMTLYYLELDSKNLLLKDFNSKKVIEKYALMRPPVSGGSLTCAEQYRIQYEHFVRNILPGLKATANRTCNAFRYCVQYYCNGRPWMSVMYLIKPTNTKCLYDQAMLRAEIRRYNFDIRKIDR